MIPFSQLPSPAAIRWRWFFLGFIGIFSLLAQWQIFSLDFQRGFERLIHDRLIQVNSKPLLENRIVIIDIDEQSLTDVGAWPWSRDTLATLVEILLADYKVRHVGLDIVFPAGSDSGGDARLLALAQTSKLTLAQVFDLQPRENKIFSGQPVFMQLTDGLEKISKYSVGASGYVANHRGLSSASCVGNIGLQPEEDGVVRRVPWVAEWGGDYSPILPVAMLQCDQGISKIPFRSDLNLMANPAGKIEYSRAWSSYVVIPASDIFERKVDLNILNGRWVLVGASALGLNDRVVTPLGGVVAGVMVHAAALSTLLDWMDGESFPAYPGAGNFIAACLIIVSLLLLGYGVSRWNAWILIPVAAICAVIWLLLAAVLLSKHYVVQVTPLLLAVFIFFLFSPLEWWWLQRDQRKILHSFKTYVGSDVLNQMLQQGINHPLKPKYAEIVVLSADMQGYTSLINRSGLNDAADLTTGFLNCLTQPLLEADGTLDKYTGDGLIGFWGAPLPVKNSADCAVRAALGMLCKVRQWNESRVMQGFPPARVRIGIEMGIALVGDLGTEFRSTYTAVGDCVNTASKLQSAAKSYEYDLLLGEQAAAHISMHQLYDLGELSLPGFSKTFMIFTVVGAVRSLDGIALRLE